MKMKSRSQQRSAGFSLIELTIAMTVMLVGMGIVATLMGKAVGVKARESRTSDALATAQAAIDVISREISNSGFGLYTDPTSQVASNGLVVADSAPESGGDGQSHRIRIISNFENEGGTAASPGPTTLAINRPGEDVTYFFDSDSKSIVRYDPMGLETSPGVYEPLTSVVVNRISNVTFKYFDYAGGTSASSGPYDTPTINTGRVRIIVEVELERVSGQPDNQTVVFSSDVTLRNNSYMLKQY